MRTIKFRGYSKDFTENEWFFGNIIDKGNGSFQILEKNPKIWDLSYDGITVIPESIGQFTGLHDKNGKEIYEGDICKLVKAPNMDFIKDKNPFEVRYGKGAQFYGYVDGWLEDVHLYDLENYEYEVLGNIYENPELISKTPTHEN